MRAQEFDGLDIDRTGLAGFKPVRPAAVVDTWPLRVGYLVDAAFDSCDRVLGILRKAFRLSLSVREHAELAISFRAGIETAVEQSVRNPGLLLHLIGERN